MKGVQMLLNFLEFICVCVHALKGLTLLRASQSSEIALADSRRLHSSFVAAPVLFAHAAVTLGTNT